MLVPNRQLGTFGKFGGTFGKFGGIFFLFQRQRYFTVSHIQPVELQPISGTIVHSLSLLTDLLYTSHGA